MSIRIGDCDLFHVTFIGASGVGKTTFLEVLTSIPYSNFDAFFASVPKITTLAKATEAHKRHHNDAAADGGIGDKYDFDDYQFDYIKHLLMMNQEASKKRRDISPPPSLLPTTRRRTKTSTKKKEKQQRQQPQQQQMMGEESGGGVGGGGVGGPGGGSGSSGCKIHPMYVQIDHCDEASAHRVYLVDTPGDPRYGAITAGMLEGRSSMSNAVRAVVLMTTDDDFYDVEDDEKDTDNGGGGGLVSKDGDDAVAPASTNAVTTVTKEEISKQSHHHKTHAKKKKWQLAIDNALKQCRQQVLEQPRQGLNSKTTTMVDNSMLLEQQQQKTQQQNSSFGNGGGGVSMPLLVLHHERWVRGSGKAVENYVQQALTDIVAMEEQEKEEERLRKRRTAKKNKTPHGGGGINQNRSRSGVGCPEGEEEDVGVITSVNGLLGGERANPAVTAAAGYKRRYNDGGTFFVDTFYCIGSDTHKTKGMGSHHHIGAAVGDEEEGEADSLHSPSSSSSTSDQDDDAVLVDMDDTFPSSTGQAYPGRERRSNKHMHYEEEGNKGIGEERREGRKKNEKEDNEEGNKDGKERRGKKKKKKKRVIPIIPFARRMIRFINAVHDRHRQQPYDRNTSHRHLNQQHHHHRSGYKAAADGAQTGSSVASSAQSPQKEDPSHDIGHSSSVVADPNCENNDEKNDGEGGVGGRTTSSAANGADIAQLAQLRSSLSIHSAAAQLHPQQPESGSSNINSNHQLRQKQHHHNHHHHDQTHRSSLLSFESPSSSSSSSLHLPSSSHSSYNHRPFSVSAGHAPVVGPADGRRSGAGGTAVATTGGDTGGTSALTASAAAAAASEYRFTMALLGPPKSGKSTLLCATIDKFFLDVYYPTVTPEEGTCHVVFHGGRGGQQPNHHHHVVGGAGGSEGAGAGVGVASGGGVSAVRCVGSRSSTTTSSTASATDQTNNLLSLPADVTFNLTVRDGGGMRDYIKTATMAIVFVDVSAEDPIREASESLWQQIGVRHHMYDRHRDNRNSSPSSMLPYPTVVVSTRHDRGCNASEADLCRFAQSIGAFYEPIDPRVDNGRLFADMMLVTQEREMNVQKQISLEWKRMEQRNRSHARNDGYYDLLYSHHAESTQAAALRRNSGSAKLAFAVPFTVEEMRTKFEKCHIGEDGCVDIEQAQRLYSDLDVCGDMGGFQAKQVLAYTQGGRAKSFGGDGQLSSTDVRAYHTNARQHAVLSRVDSDRLVQPGRMNFDEFCVLMHSLDRN